ncbi:MAG: hypothetical protein LIO49_01440 [Ruminococcus sp.]|nr:hypothetical protein [Ruminococcus sp.]
MNEVFIICIPFTKCDEDIIPHFKEEWNMEIKKILKAKPAPSGRMPLCFYVEGKVMA